VGERKFAVLKADFGKKLYVKIRDTMNSNSYKRATDEEKNNMIDKIKSKEFERMLRVGKYKKPKK
jgi:hypothetical protein